VPTGLAAGDNEVKQRLWGSPSDLHDKGYIPIEYCVEWSE